MTVQDFFKYTELEGDLLRCATMHWVLSTKWMPADANWHGAWWLPALQCAEAIAGRRFFDELDTDGDKRITVKDLRTVMKQRNLPEHYADHFLANARGPRWWAQSIGYADC